VTYDPKGLVCEASLLKLEAFVASLSELVTIQLKDVSVGKSGPPCFLARFGAGPSDHLALKLLYWEAF
jgi:hypothetical protein